MKSTKDMWNRNSYITPSAHQTSAFSSTYNPYTSHRLCGSRITQGTKQFSSTATNFARRLMPNELELELKNMLPAASQPVLARAPYSNAYRSKESSTAYLSPSQSAKKLERGRSSNPAPGSGPGYDGQFTSPRRSYIRETERRVSAEPRANYDDDPKDKAIRDLRDRLHDCQMAEFNLKKAKDDATRHEEEDRRLKEQVGRVLDDLEVAGTAIIDEYESERECTAYTKAKEVVECAQRARQHLTGSKYPRKCERLLSVKRISVATSYSPPQKVMMKGDYRPASQGARIEGLELEVKELKKENERLREQCEEIRNAKTPQDWGELNGTVECLREDLKAKDEDIAKLTHEMDALRENCNKIGLQPRQPSLRREEHVSPVGVEAKATKLFTSATRSLVERLVSTEKRIDKLKSVSVAVAAARKKQVDGLKAKLSNQAIENINLMRANSTMSKELERLKRQVMVTVQPRNAKISEAAKLAVRERLAEIHTMIQSVKSGVAEEMGGVRKDVAKLGEITRTLMKIKGKVATSVSEMRDSLTVLRQEVVVRTNGLKAQLDMSKYNLLNTVAKEKQRLEDMNQGIAGEQAQTANKLGMLFKENKALGERCAMAEAQNEDLRRQREELEEKAARQWERMADLQRRVQELEEAAKDREAGDEVFARAENAIKVLAVTNRTQEAAAKGTMAAAGQSLAAFAGKMGECSQKLAQQTEAVGRVMGKMKELAMTKIRTQQAKVQETPGTNVRLLFKRLAAISERCAKQAQDSALGTMAAKLSQLERFGAAVKLLISKTKQNAGVRTMLAAEESDGEIRRLVRELAETKAKYEADISGAKRENEALRLDLQERDGRIISMAKELPELKKANENLAVEVKQMDATVEAARAELTRRLNKTDKAAHSGDPLEKLVELAAKRVLRRGMTQSRMRRRWDR